MSRAVFLDRDNTLIANDGDLGDPDLVFMQPGVGGALRSLRDAGFVLIVVTNQGGVARGLYSEREVDAVNQRIAHLIDQEAEMVGVIDRFYYCPYHPEGTVPEYRREHPWRKPQPGMLIQAARDLELDLKSCWMIGDQARDVAAGKAAGCRTILISRDKSTVASAKADFAVGDLDEAVQIILKSESPGTQSKKATPVASRAVPRSGAARPQPIPTSRKDGPAPPSTSGVPSVAGPGDGPARSSSDLEPLRRSMQELTDELRTQRLSRIEFTPLRMGAGLCQLGVLLLALLAVLQMDNFEIFMRWAVGALLAQAFTIALLLLDQQS